MDVGGESVVPVVGWGTEAVDGGMQGDHRGGGGFSSGVGVESAMYGVTAVQQGSQPARIRAGSGGRDAEAARLQRFTADRVDRRFTQDHGPGFSQTCAEVTLVLPRAASHSAPHSGARATQLSADRRVCGFRFQQENGVSSLIRIQPAGCNQRFEKPLGKTTRSSQIAMHLIEPARIGHWQTEWCGWPCRPACEMQTSESTLHAPSQPGVASRDAA